MLHVLGIAPSIVHSRTFSNSKLIID